MFLTCYATWYAVAEQAPVGQVGKGALGDMLYSLFFKASVAPTVVPGGPSLVG